MSSWFGISVVRGMLGWGVSDKRCSVRIVRDGEQCLASLSLELANTIPRRARGLMGRAALEGRDGMLFVYPWPRIVRIWMAGTHIPLDAMFVDRSGLIVKVVADLQPHCKKWVFSEKPVKWVLELAAGRAAKLGVAVGDRVELDH